MLATALGACRPHASVGGEDGGRRIESPPRLALADVTNTHAAVDDAGTLAAPDPVRDASTGVVVPSSRAGTVALERAAGVDVHRVLAVGGGHLYRLDGDHWQRLQFEDAEARDVVYSHGALWVLARGTGPNLGRTLVLRSYRGDDLEVVATPALGVDSDPRALITLREGEYIIAGAHPSLITLVGDQITTLARGIPPVVSIRLLHDDMIVARHDAEHISLVRYGVVTSLVDPDYLDTVVDTNGTSYLVHAHGEFSRGRPGREYDVATTATPFEPRLAAAFPGERILAVGSGGPYAEWAHHDWHATVGDFPRDPIAILPADPVLVVGHDGQVSAVEAGGARVVVTGGV